MLTNWFTIKNCISKLKYLSEEKVEKSSVNLTKKESLILQKRKTNVYLLRVFFNCLHCLFLLKNSFI